MRAVMIKTTLLVASTLAAGCFPSTISSMSATLNPAPRPMAARAAADVELFTSGAPARPHVDVELLWIDSGVDHGIAELLAQARLEGARHGCDGVVVGNMQIVGYDKSPDARIAIATCIAYR
ncbi:MAG TPA: hypothetical protein VH143_10260 [Kofleriaceae bacterium]|nr:hypothetical protein [Kofleriaceae bacterium]